MVKEFISKNFLETNLSVSANTTLNEGTDFTSVVMDTSRAVAMSITLYAVGDTGGTGQITFKFVSYSDALGGWDTNPFKILSIALNGTNPVRETFVLPAGVGKIKLLSVTNSDTTYAATVNASLQKIDTYGYFK